MDMSLSKLQEIVKDREPGMPQSMGSQRDRHDMTEQARNMYSLLGVQSLRICSLLQEQRTLLHIWGKDEEFYSESICLGVNFPVNAI